VEKPKGQTAMITRLSFLSFLIMLLFSVPSGPGLWTCAHAHEGHAHPEERATGAMNPKSPGVIERLGQRLAVNAVVRDEEGRAVRLGDLVTVPTILLPVFYNCSDACNFLQANVAKILPKVDLVPGAEFQVLSLSFDYTESPEMARQARTDFLSLLGKNWPSSAWRFLTGDQQNIALIMGSIGFQYLRNEDRFTHPIVIITLAPGGKIVRYLYGFEPLPFDFTMALTEANEGRPGLSIKRALTYCFSYDPEKRRYSLNMLRIGGVAVLGLAVAFFLALILGGRRKWRTKK
jgi:protein SCO1